METTEKIYCCDIDDNDNALAAAILAGNNRKDDWSTISPYTRSIRDGDCGYWCADVTHK